MQWTSTRTFAFAIVLSTYLAVVTQGAQRNSFRRLYIQGVSNSGDSLPSMTSRVNLP